MFGRNRTKSSRRVVHTPQCAAIHEAMLMSLYLGYGAPSAPLFIPTGSLVCTCDQGGSAETTEKPEPQLDIDLCTVLVPA